MEGGLRMSGSRLAWLALVSVALLVSLDCCVLAQAPSRDPQLADEILTARQERPAVNANDSTCVVHQLGVLGDDPKLCKWIVDTLPEMIQPGTWSQRTESGAARRRISYYAPGKVIVVCHTPAVQTEVKAFLTEMQKSVARPGTVAQVRGTGTPDVQVLPAQLTEVGTGRTSEPAAGTRGAYPIPTPEKQPKHLFHLIIRYEGDGIDGAALAGLMNQIGATDAGKEADKSAPDAAKSAALGQLLHFIVRYEGEGIIDSNVAALLKDIYGANANSGCCRAPSAPPCELALPPMYTGSGPVQGNAPNLASPNTGPVGSPAASPTNGTPSSAPPLPSGAPDQAPRNTAPSTTPAVSPTINNGPPPPSGPPVQAPKKTPSPTSSSLPQLGTRP
jgi:hypothetical protein